MNRGVPQTAWNARTGEFTPPGVTARARSNNSCERACAWTSVVTMPSLAGSPHGADPAEPPFPPGQPELDRAQRHVVADQGGHHLALGPRAQLAQHRRDTDP